MGERRRERGREPRTDAEGDASHSASSERKTAFCWGLPMEEHPQRRIRSLPSVQKVRRIVNEGCCERVSRCDRKHTPLPVLPCERRRAAETRGSRLALLLRQVADELAGCIFPATSDFSGEDEELAHFGHHQFGKRPAFGVFDVGNGRTAGGYRCTCPRPPGGCKRGDQC